MDFSLTSNRVSLLRESVLSKTPSVCIERARYLTEGYKENESEHLYIKRAKAIQKVFENISIYIKENELIVGNQSSDERTAPIFPEYSVSWIKEELTVKGNFNKREGDNFYLPEDNIDELMTIIDYWNGKTLKDKCTSVMPDILKKASEVKVIHGEGNMTSGDGHIIPDFEKVLNIGLDGIIKEAKERLSKINISDTDAIRQISFLKSVIIINESIINFAKRYSELAFSLSSTEKNPTRKNELLKISEICNSVPKKPATTFYEAIQSVWFVHLAIQLESNGHSASLGRLDQYLYKYYKADIDKNILTKDSAKELLQLLWIKLYSILKIRPTSHSGYGAGYPTYQNVTIGGQYYDGSSSVNPLSYLILESVAETKLTQPNLSARVSINTPNNFIRLCANVISCGFGMPALHNDEIIIPSLLSRGVSYKDAYNYSMVGCVEVAVPGKWGYRCTGMTFLNFLKVFELTLNSGYDKRTGYTLHSNNNYFKGFNNYNDLYSAYKKDLSHYINLAVSLDKVADTMLLDFPDIFCSSLVDNCIERCKIIKEGGAVYDIISGPLVGLTNVANSLASLKKLVYDDNILSLDDILCALDNNFKGEKGQSIQKLMLNAPKYGNDDDYVDNIAISLYKDYSKELSKYTNTRYGLGPVGGNYSLSTSAISSNVPMGIVTAATPDGRNAYTPVAEGCSPTQGSDTNGPTSVLKTISKLPNILMTGGQLLNIKISPDLIQDNTSFEKFIFLIKSFILLKVWHIQFNIVSSETLKAAQIDPNKYRDLIVRVAGYCAQFITLDPVTQEDIINRTEQSI